MGKNFTPQANFSSHSDFVSPQKQNFRHMPKVIHTTGLSYAAFQKTVWMFAFTL